MGARNGSGAIGASGMGRSTASSRPARLQEIADGVFAYVQPDGGWCLNNAGVVVGSDNVVLVDTAATQRRADALRASVARAADGRLPRIVVNTHHHGDHTFGNCRFEPGAIVVAHELCRTEMSRAGLGMRTLWPSVEWGEVQVTLPSVTFQERLTLHTGDLCLELIHLGPAHTTNDVVVWISEHSVLFAGDIVMSGATPFCLMGSVVGSLHAIRQLRSLGAVTVVAGHGPVCGPEVFDVAESYLEWVQKLARYGVAEGLSPRELAGQAELGEFAGLLDSERLVANLHRAYVEAGCGPPAPLDVLGVFQEMVAYHGGTPACHA
jgi:cyclase